MTTADRRVIALASYAAFASGDRAFFEDRLSADFRFSSPPDPLLDRDGWFERCWPGAGRGQRFRLIRALAGDDEIVVTYELVRPDGRVGRNTEVLSFDEDDRIVRTEVYFGWDVA